MIVHNENEKDNALCIALLYRYRTHICTNFSFALTFYTIKYNKILYYNIYIIKLLANF